MDKQELLNIYNLPLDELLKMSQKYVSNNIELCSLVNAKNGNCSQNCKYCAQSAHYSTDIKDYPLISSKEVVEAAKDARENGVIRFAVVTSGKAPSAKDFEKILDLIDELNKVEGIRSCASLGILNEEQVKALAERGLKRFHHNINTSESYYNQICTTHSWQDRLRTCKLIKKYGMELCCGVILGMGESVEQRIEMALELKSIEPDSIPINILMPIPKTPFENYFDKIDDENILRTLAVFKIANPKSVLRFCGGRVRMSEETKQKALKYCVEGILTGNLLTTVGKTSKEDIENIEKLNKNLVKI